jgi:hypothetical protein
MTEENQVRILRLMAQRFIDIHTELMTLRTVLTAQGLIEDQAFERALAAARREQVAALEARRAAQGLAPLQSAAQSDDEILASFLLGFPRDVQ